MIVAQKLSFFLFTIFLSSAFYTNSFKVIENGSPLVGLIEYTEIEGQLRSKNIVPLVDYIFDFVANLIPPVKKIDSYLFKYNFLFSNIIFNYFSIPRSGLSPPFLS